MSHNKYPGVAQLVARMVRVHEAPGSNPGTPTKIDKFFKKLVDFSFCL